jgi:RNA polymerase sigma factor (sigma-70 family)
VKTDWSRVYRTVYPELVRYLYRKLWDQDRAHDLAQEAFLRALDREPEDPRRWLFTVAGNLARDEVRTTVRRRRHLTLLEGGGEALEPAPDPLAELEHRERREGAKRALASLGERDREVLLLWDAGFSYEEIAERTGLARGAVGTTLARARQRLTAAYRTSGRNDVARG